jgi:hypothetical protein
VIRSFKETENPLTYRAVKRYQQIGVWDGWGIERFKKACRLLGETPEELAVSCAINIRQLRQWMNHGFFPSYAALLFHMREQDWFRAQGLKK